MKEFEEGREVVLRAVIGSYNYNLQGTNSDMDYKRFVLPNFNDLYEGKQFYREFTSEDMDNVTYDVRKLASLLYKANPAFLEILFSRDITIDERLKFLLKQREELVYSIRFRMYKSTFGAFQQKMKRLYNHSEKDGHFNEKEGYNNKHAYNAIRHLDFLLRYRRMGNFLNAMFYELDDPVRKLLIGVKEGKFSLSVVLHEVEQRLKVVSSDNFREFFDQKEENEHPIFAKMQKIFQKLTMDQVVNQYARN